MTQIAGNTFLSTIKKNYINKYKLEYKIFLSNDNYIISFANKNIMIFYDDFTKPINNFECSLSAPKIIKTSNNNIAIKILDKFMDNFRLIILYNVTKNK